ncbi:hypothetical protein [Nonomuraea maritima]|uniref:hypothetical protein n=1 Tax=Nonomuraea maritima TaxID=683260 RepID=UPI00115FCE35|nr:hypothetical protein [Nonomuraea maritima]
MLGFDGSGGVIRATGTSDLCPDELGGECPSVRVDSDPLYKNKIERGSVAAVRRGCRCGAEAVTGEGLLIAIKSLAYVLIKLALVIGREPPQQRRQTQHDDGGDENHPALTHHAK